MYICICNGITEDQLKKVAAKGYQGKEALAKLGVGDSCGICVLDALKNLTSKFPVINSKKTDKPS
jgi:bacterioferritin-associated ferredoxin